jgi:microcystin-dependent protein
MSRNGSGTYSVPNTFSPGDTIASSTHNQNFSDLGNEITNSVAADGQTSMTGPLKASAGSLGAPSQTFASDQDTGRYRKASNTMADVCGGAEVVEISSSGLAVTGDVSASGVVKQAGFSLLPVGMVVPYAGSSAPTGYLLCYGQAVSRTTYASLFAVLGTTFGSGDGSTTFNVPDINGRVVAGADGMGGASAGRLTDAVSGIDALGDAGGSQSRTLVTANLPPYTPTVASASVSVTSTISTVQNNSAGNVSDNFAGGSTDVPRYNPSSLTSTGTASITMNAQGGTSTAFSIVQPTIVLNYIIFAGV